MSVIDSLVIELGLDASGLSKGAKSGIEQLRKFENQADKTASDVSDSGQKAAEFFSKVRREALGMFAVFTAGRSIKAFISDITKSNAQLGYLSQRLGIAPAHLYRMEQAAAAAGGTIGEVGDTFASVQQKLLDPQQRGDVANAFRRLGVGDFIDPKTGGMAEDILGRVNKAISQNHIPPAIAQALLGQIGFAQGQINEALMKPEQFNHLQGQFDGLGPTPKQIHDSQQLLEDWQALEASTESVGRNVLGDWVPSLDHLMTRLTDWEKANPTLAKSIAEVTLAVAALGVAVGGVAVVGGALGLARLPGAIKGLKGTRGAAGLAEMAGCCCGEGGIGKKAAEGEAAARGAKASERAAEATESAAKNTTRAAEGAETAATRTATLAERLGRPGMVAGVGAGAGAEVVGGGSVVAGALSGLLLPAFAAYLTMRPTAANSNESEMVARLRSEGRIGPVPQDMKDREAKAISILGSMGFSRNASLGIVGNLLQESQLNPGAVGDSGQAHGLAQHHADRIAEIKEDFGIDMRTASFEDQVRGVALEMKRGKDRGARRAGELLSDPNISVAEATHIDRQFDERPRDQFGQEDNFRYALAQRADRDTRSQSPGQTTVHTGDIHVHTSATDADGIARDIKPALNRQLASYSATGMQ